MLKNQWNTFKISLFGQTTTQPLNNSENLENTSNSKGWGLKIVAYKKVHANKLGNSSVVFSIQSR